MRELLYFIGYGLFGSYIYVPGTGIPVPYGLTPQLLLKTMIEIISYVNIIDFDIFEYNPMLNKNDITGLLILNIIAYIFDSIFFGF